MILLLAGPQFENFKMGNYLLSKLFDSPDYAIVYNYFCNKFNEVLYSTSKKKFKKCTLTCLKCNLEQHFTLKSKNYFISLDLEYQLKMLIDKKEEYEELFKPRCDTTNTDNLIRDVYDGDLYKQINIPPCNDNDTVYVTYNYSTDGAPLTKSGKRGFWPLQIIINNLSPKLRFKNVLLAGVLSCTQEPKSSLISSYFDIFLKQVNKLKNGGVRVINKSGQSVKFVFYPLFCVLDTIARALLQNRKQFNAYFGCSWCYHLGKYFKKLGIRYPLKATTELRSNKSHKEEVRLIKSKVSGKVMSSVPGTSSKNKKRNNKNLEPDHRGVKGDISLSQIPSIDMVWSFVWEYMHIVLSGIDTQINRNWTSSKSKSKFKLTKKQI